MNLNKLGAVPDYTDGFLTVYDIIDAPEPNNPDFPMKKLKKREIGKIWYRAEAVFDKTRLTFQQQDIELTMKVRIPRWDGINSQCVCVINGKQHKVYNRADVISKQGYRETELTLINPETEYEVLE